jgi:hypothetical protein
MTRKHKPKRRTRVKRGGATEVVNPLGTGLVPTSDVKSEPKLEVKGEMAQEYKSALSMVENQYNQLSSEFKKLGVLSEDNTKKAVSELDNFERIVKEARKSIKPRSWFGF